VDAIKFLTRQHQQLETLFKQYERNPERGEQLFPRIERALVPHAEIEEMHLYPFIRERVPSGLTLSEHAIHEHSQVEELLEEIGKMIRDQVPYDASMHRLIDSVRQHVHEEEEVPGLFGLLRQSATSRELADLGKTLERSWRIAPTRAHPLAPDRPPANKVLGVPLAVIDRVRDQLSGRDTSEPRVTKRRSTRRRKPASRTRAAATRKRATATKRRRPAAAKRARARTRKTVRARRR
jgi:hemerythrin superfamily protein